MLNRIVLIGRLVRDVELRQTQTGKSVAKMTLAVDRAFAGGDGKKETDFVDCIIWGKQAETSAQYLSKGKMAAVDGRLQIRMYEGKDGIKRQACEVVADNVRFLSPRAESTQGQYVTIEEMGMTSDDLPF